jgi:hypothetical protein
MAIIESDIIQDKELDLRSPIAGVGNPGTLQVLFCLLGDVPGITGIGLTRDGITDIADKV